MLTLFFTVLGAAFGVGQGLYLVWKEAVSPRRLKRLRTKPSVSSASICRCSIALHSSCDFMRLGARHLQTIACFDNPPPPPRPSAAVVVSGLAEAGSGLTHYIH